MQAFSRTILVLLAALALMSACGPAQVTPSAEEIQAQVASAVAMTVAAQATLTAEAQPAATETLAPTLTEIPTLTPIFPTVTPFTVVPPSGGGGGGGSGAGNSSYSCDAWTQKPVDNTVFNPGEAFDIKWVITNTGTKTMVAGLDLNYLSGPKMTTNPGLELPEIKPGKTFSINFDANAPSEKGFHVMSWKVEGGLCYPYVAICTSRCSKP